jgi:hypothetical protein
MITHLNKKTLLHCRCRTATAFKSHNGNYYPRFGAQRAVAYARLLGAAQLAIPKYKNHHVNPLVDCGACFADDLLSPGFIRAIEEATPAFASGEAPSFPFELVKVVCDWVGASKVVLTGFDKRFYVKLDPAKIEDGSSIRAILLRHCDECEGPPQYIEVGFVTSRGSSQFGGIFNQDSAFVADDDGAHFNH